MSAMIHDEHPSSSLHGSYSYTNTLKAIYYGAGSVKAALPKLIKAIGGKKALVVTGKSLYTKTDVVKAVESILSSSSAHGAMFYEIGEHSPIADIRAGIRLFKESDCDFIVAVGGGSPVDASKAIIYNLQLESHGTGEQVTSWEGVIRQIAIPTTLSAAEYTFGAGYTNDQGKKVSVSSPYLAPSGIILDPELTLATPERLWLSTGMRAVDHAVENLIRPLMPPPLKYMCYQALADLFEYLPKTKKDPSDLNVRLKLQLASWMSLWPLMTEKYSALGISHALGHKLGAAYKIPHGITSCLTLAPVVYLQARIAPEEDKEWLAKSLFYLRQPSSGSLQADVEKLADMIERLVNELGLKSDLARYNVPKEDAEQIAELALGGRTQAFYGDVVKLLLNLYPN